MRPAEAYATAAPRGVAALRAALAADFAALRGMVEAGTATAPAASGRGSTLDMLAALFGLDPAERLILGVAAAAELEPAVTEAVRKATGGDRADIALAVALLPEAGWDAFCPEGPLRRWRLIELIGTGPMLRRAIAVDERVLHFLMGLNYLDARLEGLLVPTAPTRMLDAREAALATEAAAALGPDRRAPVLLIAGGDRLAKREVMAATAAEAGHRLLRVDAGDLPRSWEEREALATFLDRELALSDALLLIECAEDAHAPAAARLADAIGGPVAISAVDPALTERGPRLRLELATPEREARRALWHAAIGTRAEALGPGLDRLAEQFSLDRSGIDAAVGVALNGAHVAPDKLFGRLWQAAREQGRRRLDGLADRIVSGARWDDLVLPAEQTAQLRDMAAHLAVAWQVNQDWGWRARSPRGLGAAALFSGPSGTGKTLAAEVLAGTLALDLYRIDLSQVVSKYIGETEKNLARIFEAAEDGGAILLFDEADALFGKRSEVKDSHDRYANVEVSYLLQRMEAYRGLAILTTNQRSALDQAFLRRLRSVVTFPFPDAAARAEIWARIFPERTPTEGLVPQRLARMNLSGGSIRSVALNASFLAASAGSPVRPEHVLNAARREYAKLEKPFTASEIGAIQ